MVDLVVPNTDLKIEDLQFERVCKAQGGRLLIKGLPDYPLLDCSQAEDCFEFAEHVVVMFETGKEEPLICTLCQLHLNRLLDLQQLLIPIRITQ